MLDDAQVPIMRQAPKLMEVGPNGANLAAQAKSRHPVDAMQRRMQSDNPYQSLEHVRHVFGSALAMRLATERKIAGDQERGAAGLPSSGLYGEIVTGADVKLDFGDFLSLPEYRPDLPKENPHKVMEHQLGM